MRQSIDLQPSRPRAIPGATWQAGVTPGNERLKVLLNGEPCPAAIAASDKEGWVILHGHLHLQAVPVRSRDPLGLAYRADPFERPRIHGRVNLVKCDADD